MKKFFLLLFVLSSFYSFSQKKHGPFEDFYKNGQLKISGQHREGKKIGKWQEYYDTGELSKIYTFNNKGKKTGFQESYFKNGNLRTKTSKLKEGGFVRRGFFEENGNLFYEMILKKQPKSEFLIKSGHYKEFSENGVPKIEGNFLEGQLGGLLTKFYESGEKEWEVQCYKGIKQGFYKHYHKNGVLKIEGSIFSDIKNGEEKRYNEKGNLVWKGSYFNDNFDGIWIQYDASGNVANEFKYKKGKLKGSKKIDLKPTKVIDWILEKVPVYPGCEKLKGNNALKKCMSQKISQFVGKNFNTGLARDLGLSGRQKIFVIFKIDKTGKPVGIRARSNQKELKDEAIRVISQLPHMTPGYQRGKPVIVPYSLPIIFEVTGKVKKKDPFSDPFFKKQ